MRQQTPQDFRTSPDCRCRRSKCSQLLDLVFRPSTILVLPLPLLQTSCKSEGRYLAYASNPSEKLGKPQYAGATSSSRKRKKEASLRSDKTNPRTIRVFLAIASTCTHLCSHNQSPGDLRTQISSYSTASSATGSSIWGKPSSTMRSDFFFAGHGLCLLSRQREWAHLEGSSDAALTHSLGKRLRNEFLFFFRQRTLYRIRGKAFLADFAEKTLGAQSKCFTFLRSGCSRVE